MTSIAIVDDGACIGDMLEELRPPPGDALRRRGLSLDTESREVTADGNWRSRWADRRTLASGRGF